MSSFPITYDRSILAGYFDEAANDGAPLQEQVDATTATKMAKQFRHFLKLAKEIAAKYPVRAKYIRLQIEEAHRKLPRAAQVIAADLGEEEEFALRIQQELYTMPHHLLESNVMTAAETQNLYNYFEKLILHVSQYPIDRQDTLHNAREAMFRMSAPTLRALHASGSYLAYLSQIARGGNVNPKG